MAQPAAVINLLVRANTAQANLGLAKVNAQARIAAGRFGEVDKAGHKTSQNLKNFAKVGVGAAVGGLAVFGVAAKKSVTAAVDLGEEINKTKVVFRGSEQQILQWSKSTAFSLGISRREALQSAGVFGNMLVPMGFARDRAGEMSVRMVKLAADMASFNNASPKETLDALRAGLAGESEPLRRYGVFLNDARLKQEALNLHLKNAVGANGALTTNAKAQATYSLILKDSKDAQGDFARTSGSLANQQRILRAQLENASAALGKKLIPMLAAAMKWLTRFINEMQTGRGAGGRFAHQMREIGRVLEDVWPWIRRVANATKIYGEAVLGVNAGPLPKFIRLMIQIGNPISRAIIVIKLLIGVVRTLGRFFSSVYQLGRRLANVVGDTLAPAFRTLKDVVNAALAPLRKAYGIFKDIRDIAGSVGGKLGSIGKSINPFGSGQALDEFFGQFAPFAPFTGKLGSKGAKSVDAFTPLAGRYGLSMTSGYRPGDDGWHGVNRARDYSGDAGKMIQFAQFMAKTFGGKLLELIHTPLGFGIKNGSRVPLSFWGSAVNADHFDHVHVAMEKGGRTGQKVRALVGEKGPEIVDLPAGSFVHTAQKTKQMLPGYAAGGWVRAAHAGRAAGFRGRALKMMLAIGGAESGNYTSFVGDGGQSFSPWQIYHPAHPQYDTHRLLTDWTYAAKAAYAISGGGSNWTPWTMYNNGGYRSYMGAAARAIAQTAGKTKQQARHHAKRVAQKVKKLPKKIAHWPSEDAGNIFMQAYADQIGMRQALAALTPDLADDITVAQDAVRGWAAWLDWAKSRHDTAAITDAATQLKTWQDNLGELLAPAADTAGDDSGRAALLQQLLTEANLRTGVSQAQYGVLRGMPAVGAPGFASGGAVVHNTVNFSGNAGWLERFVDQRIQQTTRTSRSTPLPGRGGGLQR